MSSICLQSERAQENRRPRNEATGWDVGRANTKRSTHVAVSSQFIFIQHFLSHLTLIFGMSEFKWIFFPPTDRCTPWQPWCWRLLFQVRNVFLVAPVLTDSYYHCQLLQCWRFFFPHFSSAISNLLFPALSLLAVGGIMLLITNMQVGAVKFQGLSFYPKWRFAILAKNDLKLTPSGGFDSGQTGLLSSKENCEAFFLELLKLFWPDNDVKVPECSVLSRLSSISFSVEWVKEDLNWKRPSKVKFNTAHDVCLKKYANKARHKAQC